MTYRLIVSASLCTILLCTGPSFGQTTVVFGEYDAKKRTSAPAQQVVQAYRTPSDEDLQWLFENKSNGHAVCIAAVGESTVSKAVFSDVVRSNAAVSHTMMIPSITEFPTILQAAYLGDATAPSEFPVHTAPDVQPISTSPLPSDVETAELLLELPREGDIVLAAAFLDTSELIEQMSTLRQAPPGDTPKELDISMPASPVRNVIEERMPWLPNDQNNNQENRQKVRRGIQQTGYAGHREAKSTCLCLTCILCGNHQKKQSPKNAQCSDKSWDDEYWMTQFNDIYGDETCSTGRSRQCQAVPYGTYMIGTTPWLSGYSVAETAATSGFAMPSMLLTRLNITEHFDARVQNRAWSDYRHWNNAVALNGEERGIDQFSFGLEKTLLHNASIELRMPVVYQYASNPNDSTTALEVGNVSGFLKRVIYQNDRWTIASGGGLSLPTAKNWEPLQNARLDNKIYYLASFIGIQWHPNAATFGQFVLQTDTPVKKHELSYAGNSVEVKGQEFLRMGVQLGRWIYRSDYSSRPCRIGLLGEVHYVKVIRGSPAYEVFAPATTPTATPMSVSVSRFDPQESVLTASAGLAMVFGNLTCTNSFTLPMSGSGNPFSVGYNFSISRQF